MLIQADPSKKEGLETEAQTHRIRITLASRNVKSLEKGTLPSLSVLTLVIHTTLLPSVLPHSIALLSNRLL
jgi:hypothetical protein